MTTKQAPLVAVRIILVCILLLLAFGVVHGQGDLKISNTAKETSPGLYECIIYLEIDREVADTIDDVTYTLPPGYPRRKLRGRTRAGVDGFFSSAPITTTEEAVVNVKIAYKGTDDVFLSYKLKLFKASLK